MGGTAVHLGGREGVRVNTHVGEGAQSAVGAAVGGGVVAHPRNVLGHLRRHLAARAAVDVEGGHAAAADGGEGVPAMREGMDVAAQEREELVPPSPVRSLHAQARHAQLAWLLEEQRVAHGRHMPRRPRRGMRVESGGRGGVAHGYNALPAEPRRRARQWRSQLPAERPLGAQSQARARGRRVWTRRFPLERGGVESVDPRGRGGAWVCGGGRGGGGG